MARKILSRGAWILGLGLTLAQVGIALRVAPNPDLKDAYTQLCAWDCRWYERIAVDGYRTTIPPTRQDWNLSNVGFFPAYPVLGRAVLATLRIPPRVALLLTAQLFGALFWAALWTWLVRWRIPLRARILVVLAVFCHPAAFYLVAGYSEPLFLASLLLYLSEQASAFGWFAGFTLSATRIVGLTASIYPFARKLPIWIQRQRLPSRRELWGPSFRALIPLTGIAAFFAYCHGRFGKYDLYLETQHIGWGITPDYAGIFKWASFDFLFKHDAVATWASGAAFMGVVLGEVMLWRAVKRRGMRRSTGLGRRFPLYAVAFAMFWISLSGAKSVSFLGMIRYSLPWAVLLLVSIAHYAQRIPELPKRARNAAFALAVLGCACVFAFGELPGLSEFLNDRWFASTEGPSGDQLANLQSQ